MKWKFLLISLGICIALCYLFQYALIFAAILIVVIMFKIVVQWNRLKNWLQQR